MTSLAALQIHDLTEPLHPSFFKAMSHFVSVTELDLRGAALYNLQTLQRLISALRYLEILRVSGLCIKRTRRDGSTATHRQVVPSSVPVLLRTLGLEASTDVVQHVHYVHFIEWLIRESICESLSHLTLRGPLQRRTYPQPLGPNSSALIDGMIKLIETAGTSF